MDFEVVKTEYASGHICGADFGSKVRIIMRSPLAVLFVGYGVNLSTRGNLHCYASLTKLGEKAGVELFSKPEVRAKVVTAFGEGADDAVLKAFDARGMGTVLFEEGGDKLPLPDIDRRRDKEARYKEIGPDATFDLPGIKTCVQCGKPLTPLTAHHRMGDHIEENHPRSVEDCQRLSNHPVYSVKGFGPYDDEEKWPYVEWFETWDGEDYIDDTFCNTACAAQYGRRAAKALPLLEAGIEPETKDRPPREDFNHYDEEAARKRQHESLVRAFGKEAVERSFEGPDGTTFKY